jgi:hypothetical protein
VLVMLIELQIIQRSSLQPGRSGKSSSDVFGLFDITDILTAVLIRISVSVFATFTMWEPHEYLEYPLGTL